MSPPVQSNDSIRTVRVSAQERNQLLRALAQKESCSPAAHQRTSARQRYDLPDGLPMRVEHPGGSVGYYKVEPINLSDGGLGFLHGAFMHIGTACVARMTTSDGEQVLIPGKVARCKCIRGTIHKIGVKFHRRIDINNFLATEPADPDSSDEPAPTPTGGLTFDFDTVARLADQLGLLARQEASPRQLKAEFDRLAQIVDRGPAP